MAEETNTANLKAILSLIVKLDESSFKKVKDDLKSVQGDTARAGSVAPGSTPARTNLADKIPTVSSNAGKETSSTPSKSLADNLPLISKKEDKEESKSSSMDLSQVTRMLGSGESGGTGALNAEKGMKGGAKAGAAGAALMVLEKLLALLQQLVQIAMDSSPLFQSMAKLFNTSMKLLFMPLGQMMAKVLMPIVLKYLQKSADTAQKYMNAPPSSAEEVMANATNNMLSATGEVFGKVLTDILPPIFMGFLNGMVEAIKGLFGMGKSPTEAFNNAIAEATKKYNDAFSTSGMTLVKGAEGYATALDQFGMVMYTANNTLGKSISDAAITIYSGATDIADGFNITHDVVTYGTPAMIEYVNDKYKTIAANTSSTFDTITGHAWTTGQALDLLGQVAENSMFQFFSVNEPIDSVIDSLGNLSLGLNIMAKSFPLIVRDLKAEIRKETLVDEGFYEPAAYHSEKSNIWGVNEMFKLTSEENQKSARINYTTDKALYDSLGLNRNKSYSIWTASGAYKVVDDDGKNVKTGYFDKNAVLKTVKEYQDSLGFWDSRSDSGSWAKLDVNRGAHLHSDSYESIYDALTRAQAQAEAHLSGKTTTSTNDSFDDTSEEWKEIKAAMDELNKVSIVKPLTESSGGFDFDSYIPKNMNDYLSVPDSSLDLNTGKLDWDAYNSSNYSPKTSKNYTTIGYANDFTSYDLNSTKTGNFSKTVESVTSGYGSGVMGSLPRYETEQNTKKQENINLNMSIYGDVLGINDIEKEVESMIDNYLATRRSGF